jgi:ribonuclease HII
MLKTRFLQDSAIEAGVDEVGRGCLWGPLITGAVIWLPEEEWTEEVRTLSMQIKDSKKMTEKKRNQLAALIKDYAIDFSIGVVEPSEIDALGMTRSNQLAFARAVRGLTVDPDRLLVDGILQLSRSDWSGEQHTIVEGDAQYIPIAAASILAKVHRDSWVQAWCEANKESSERYGLESSKGYGTAVHRAALQAHGPHELHRRLFLRKILGDDIYKPPEQQCQIQDEADIY